MRRWLSLCLVFATALTPTACATALQGGNEVTPTLPGEDPVPDLAGAAGDGTAPKKPKKPAKPKPAPSADPKDPWAGRKDLVGSGARTAPRRVPVPTLERFTLPNGVRVLAVPWAGETVSVHLVIPAAGSDQEPNTLRGVAEATAYMLPRGVKGQGKAQVTARVAKAGAAFATNIDAEGVHVTCDALAAELPACLALVTDVTTQPSFPAAEFEPVKRELLSTARARHDDAQSLATMHVRNLLWGDDAPRGGPPTELGLGTLTVKDLAAWHQARYTPKGAILVVVGRFEPAKLRAALGGSVGRWTGPKTTPEVVTPTLAAPKGRRVRLIDRPDATQATIMVARDGVAHADEDYLPMLLVNDVLGGGGPSARLTKAQLAGKAKLLAARSFLERGRGRGALIVTGVAPVADAATALELFVSELDGLAKSGPSIAELEEARVGVGGAYPFGYERGTDVAAALATAELHGLDEAWVRDFPVRVAEVGLPAAKAAAAKFSPGALVVVVVGRAKDIAPALEKKGYTVERLAWTDEITARDRQLAASSPTGGADPKKAEAGKRALEQAIVARGGAKFAALTSVRASGSMKINAQGKVVDGTYTRVVNLAARSSRVEMGIPGRGTASLVLTAKAAFVAFQGQVNEVPEKDRPQLEILSAIDPERVLLAGRAKEFLVNAEEDVTLGGKTYNVVTITRSDGSMPVQILLDGKTHLPYRVYYQLDGQAVFDEYGDYRAVGGVQMPHSLRTVNVVLGVPLDITFEKIEVNVALEAKLFEKP